MEPVSPSSEGVLGTDGVELLNESRRLLGEATHRVVELEEENARVMDFYSKLRTLYLDSHLVWMETEQQNVELRAVLHNLGGAA